MLSFSELLDKTKVGRKSIENSMELNKGYHPQDANLLEDLKPADALEVTNTMRSMSLAEVLAKSGTAGIQGAAYLVAPKLHDTLIMHSQKTDIVPLISAFIVTEYQGNDLLNVQLTKHRSYLPTRFSSVGGLPTGTLDTVQAQMTPLDFGLVVPIGNDLVEDSQYGLIEWHATQAAVSFGEYASELALTTLKTATDGDGTVNGGVSGDADETKWAGGATFSVVNTDPAKSIIAQLAIDRWIPDTMICTSEAWEHSLSVTGSALANNIGLIGQLRPPSEGFHAVVGLPSLDLLFNNSPALHLWSTDGDFGAMTNCVTIVFNRANALLVARKRWLAVKNYADPVADLTGAVISARQGAVTLYNDAIGVITET